MESSLISESYGISSFLTQIEFCGIFKIEIKNNENYRKPREVS